MKLPNDGTPDSVNEDGYISDEYDQLEMLPAPIRDGDFSEYLWMEHEEEFNSQVLRELEEEELMEQCIVAMLDDEDSQVQGNGASNNATPSSATSNNLRNTSENVNGLSESVNNMSISANGIRSNPSSDNSDNSYSNVNLPPRFSVQDRLRINRVSANDNPPNEGDAKESTLNPDAKEFVPSSLNSSTSVDEKVPS